MSDKLSPLNTENLTAAVTSLLHKPLPESYILPSHNAATQGNIRNLSNKQQLSTSTANKSAPIPRKQHQQQHQQTSPVLPATSIPSVPPTSFVPLSLCSTSIVHLPSASSVVKMPPQTVLSSGSVPSPVINNTSTSLPSGDKMRYSLDPLVKSHQHALKSNVTTSVPLTPDTRSASEMRLTLDSRQQLGSDNVLNQLQVNKLLGQTIQELNTPGSIQISQSLLQNLLSGLSANSFANTLLNSGKTASDESQSSTFSQLSPTQPLQNLIQSMFPSEPQSSQVQALNVSKSQSLDVLYQSQTNSQISSINSPTTTTSLFTPSGSSAVQTSLNQIHSTTSISKPHKQSIPAVDEQVSTVSASQSPPAGDTLQATQVAVCAAKPVLGSTVDVPPSQQVLGAGQPIPILVQSSTPGGPLQVVPLTPGVDVALLQQILQQAMARPVSSSVSASTEANNAMRLSIPVQILPKPPPLTLHPSTGSVSQPSVGQESVAPPGMGLVPSSLTGHKGLYSIAGPQSSEISQTREKAVESVGGSLEAMTPPGPTSTVNTTSHTWSIQEPQQPVSKILHSYQQQQQLQQQQHQQHMQQTQQLLPPVLDKSVVSDIQDSSVLNFQSPSPQELQNHGHLFSESQSHSVLENQGQLLHGGNSAMTSDLQLVLQRQHQQQHGLQSSNHVPIIYHHGQHLTGQVQSILSRQDGEQHLQDHGSSHLEEEPQPCGHVMLNQAMFSSDGSTQGLYTQTIDVQHSGDDMHQGALGVLSSGHQGGTETHTGEDMNSVESQFGSTNQERVASLEEESLDDTYTTCNSTDLSSSDAAIISQSPMLADIVQETTQQSSQDVFSFCIDCNMMMKDGCEVHSTDSVHVYDSPILSRARASLPNCLFLDQTSTSTFKDYHGIWCKECLSERTKFGPVIGRQMSINNIDYKQQVHGFNPFRLCTLGEETVVLDLGDEGICNWMMFVRMAHSLLEQNCILYQDGNQFYMITKTEIKENEELLYWFSADMCTDLGVSQNPGNLKLLQCSECGLYFTTQRSQNSHLKSAHPERFKRTYGCVICGKKFSANSKLNNHMMSHMGVKPHRCSYCHKHFSDPSNLKTHMHIHTGEKKYKCDQCGKTFRQKAHLKLHLVTHTGLKRFECSFCHKLFSRQSDLKTHCYRHTQEFSYPCNTCGKVFYKTQNYKKHLKVHSGERNYMCNKCFKGFQTKYHRDRHLKICKEKNGKESSYMSLEEVAKLDNTCDVVPLNTVKGDEATTEVQAEGATITGHEYFS